MIPWNSLIHLKRANARAHASTRATSLMKEQKHQIE